MHQDLFRPAGMLGEFLLRGHIDDGLLAVGIHLAISRVEHLLIFHPGVVLDRLDLSLAGQSDLPPPESQTGLPQPE